MPLCNQYSPDKIDRIWLDLDDTLWDFKANSLQSLSELYDVYGLERYYQSVDHWRNAYLKLNHQLWDLYGHGHITKDTLMHDRFYKPLNEAGVPDSENLWEIFSNEYLDRLARQTKLVDGARQLLDHIHRQGYATGMLSNGFKEVQFRKLNNSGLTNDIDIVILSDDIGINKPDKRLFDHALSVVGERPERSLLIGDNPDTDICGALNAGWHAIFFDRENHGDIDNCMRVTSLLDIIKII